jgi:glycosyltransferase involved in cell wall biosynthesis
MTPVRVLVGMPFGTALGGAERFLRLLAERAPEHGLDLHVVLHERGPLERELAHVGVPVTLVPLGRFRELGTGVRAVGALRRLIREWRPDLVFGWLPRSHVYLSPAALLAGLPVARIAWWQHHRPTGEILERLATVVPATAIFCGSETVAAAQARLRPRRRTLVTHYGIAPVHRLPDAELTALRERLEIPSGRHVVGLPGRLVRWKGQHRFIDAVARLVAEGREVHGLVVGGTGHGLDEDFGPALHDQVRRLGLDERVTFTGHVEDPLPYIQLMNVLVNASIGEPFGLTLVEAQALGVPAVAVDVGGPREIIVHGESGWLVPSGEPDDLAAGMAAVLDDPERAERITARAKESYAACFTAEAGVERVARAMRDLAAAAGRS